MAPFLGNYPQRRLRRYRQQPWIRTLVAETTLTTSDLIWPVFIQEGENQETSIPSLPGVVRYTIDRLIAALPAIIDLGIQAIALFPVIPSEKKSLDAIEAFQPNNLIGQAVARIKKSFPQLGVIADVALDPYTSHGHDGIVDQDDVDNDKTIEALCRQAIHLAQAGVDAVAPSDMMDGRIGSIRQALDQQGFEKTLIISYAAKFASSFYGPFREAVGSRSSGQKIDKRTYQLDFRNGRQALHEVALDIQEGADAVIIKPANLYLDVVHQVKQTFNIPTFVYHVSGDYAMLLNAGESLDKRAALLETMFCFKRAGADAILTYAAPQIAQYLAEGI